MYVGVQQSFSFSSSSSFYDTSKLFRRNPVAHKYSRTSSDEAVPGVGLGVLEETGKRLDVSRCGVDRSVN